jgi:putative DNA methylase
MTANNSPKKKLIEVALPLDAINKAAAREKSIRHGHPSTLHLWWARRPLAAARAVIFAQMVDDPSSHPDIFRTSKAQDKERQRLFRIIEDLVKWENTTNKEVLERARAEIWQSWRSACAENVDHPRAKELFNRYQLPAFHDPFAGGGALPLEAQRLGLEAYASDLNPVAILINKAMIEIPPKFVNRPPVNEVIRNETTLIEREWTAAHGLAEDVRQYGQWMRDEAEKRIGNLYPKIEITPDLVQERPDLKPYVGRKLTVIAWLWARTVKSPNPAFAQVDIPLVSTFMLCTKTNKEVFVEPVMAEGGYSFNVRMAKPKDVEAAKNGTRAGKAQDFLCLLSGVPVPRSYVRDEGKAGRLGSRLMAIVADGDHERVYLSPTAADEVVASSADSYPVVAESKVTFLSGLTPTRAMITGGVCSAYGLSTWGDLFTSRQLIALTTFSNLVQEVRELVKHDAVAAGLTDDGKTLADGGTGATAYGDAIALYMGFGVDKMSDRHSTLTRWDPTPTASGIINTFSRQALPMTWDYAEGNPFSEASGNFDSGVGWIAKVIDGALPASPKGFVCPADAAVQNLSLGKVISTDPPYYDNIGYADLSDFFYVWLRRALKPVFPDLFTTVVVSKEGELVATPFRHGGKEKAEAFFLEGMTQAMNRLAEQSHPAFPVTIYYAFKQAESDGDEGGTASTGWDTFLAAVIRAGFAISGTWPMRTELSNRMISSGVNALASSIILVCRPRSTAAPTATRRDFVSALKAELPAALAHLQRGNIAPVDLAQAAIGPGMAVYTRYLKVLDAEGKPLSVREALSLINQTLDEALAEQEGDFDADSRWAVAWFEQSGFAEGEYGVAETLSKAKNTSVSGMVAAGILASKGGKVRLLRPDELPANWDPESDPRLTAWESVHHLVRALESGGEKAAAELAAKIGSRAEISRELAYRLYTVCERKKRAPEALSYNGLVQSWPEIIRIAQSDKQASQPQLFAQE